MKYFSFIILSFLFSFVYSLLPTSALAAEMFFSGPTNVSVGEEFTLEVLVNSEDTAFNAAEANIAFPNNILEVTSVDASPAATVFKFWLYLPLFSNEDGTVSFSGGTVRGVLGSDVKLLTINFSAIGSGEALVTADNALVNASNGRGTNILETISATRINVSSAPTFIPAKTEPLTLEPIPAPTPEPTVITAPASNEPESTTEAIVTTSTESTSTVNERIFNPEGWEALLEGGCSDIFSNCVLRFPTITNVSVEQHPKIGADIFISGNAPAGDHVHLMLIQDEIPYQEVTALIEDGRLWEARISNITAYDTYDLVAWVEDDNNVSRSEVFRWSDIEIYPPLTFNIFGYQVRWYILTSLLLGIFTIISGASLVGCLLLKKKQKLLKILTFSFGALFMATSIMSTLSYFLWKEEHTINSTYWKNTTVTCVSHLHGYKNDHGSAKLTIKIDGMSQSIPEGIGISPECIADIHTHDNTGRLHLHLHENAERATLNDFFAVAETQIERAGYNYIVTINGEDYTDQISTYELANKDEIVVTYTSIESD